jgi:transposase
LPGGFSTRRECAPSQGAHNNATERGIRGPVVGRKNHYGSKSGRGTEIAAVFYTLLETAKLARIAPAVYVREAVLADARGEVLLPSDMPR